MNKITFCQSKALAASINANLIMPNSIKAKPYFTVVKRRSFKNNISAPCIANAGAINKLRRYSLSEKSNNT